MIDLLVSVVKYTAPICFAATGETVGQKSGVINIGLEGAMLLSAFVAVEVSGRSGSPLLGLLAGVACGVLVCLIQAFFTITLNHDQVVVGTAVNLAGLGITGTLYQSLYGATGQLMKVPSLPVAFWDLTWPVLFLPAFVFAIWFLIVKTKWGLVLRAAGEYPDAVIASGFSVQNVRYQAQMLVGVFVGIAGAILTLGINPSFSENMTSGRGFIAIAMVTFGRWRPWGVFGACLLVGATEALQFVFQSQAIEMPTQFFKSLPYLVALLVLVFVGKGTVAPQSLALPLRNEA